MTAEVIEFPAVVKTTDAAEVVEVSASPTLVAATTRQLPWAGIATGKAEDGELLTSAQMLERANLNWDVGIRPFMRAKMDGSIVPSKKMFETYRFDTEDELGAVRSRYEVLQNREAFEFGDSLIQSGRGRWAEAGMQNGGTRVFMTMLLNDQFTILGQEPFQTYLFLGLGHDGGRSLRGFVTPIRVSCTNQTVAVKANNLGSFTIQHTASIRDRLENVGDMLRQTEEYQVALREEAELLVATTVTEDTARYLVTSLIPQTRSKREQMIEDILSNLKNSPNLEGHRGDGWGLVNAASEYMQHQKTQRSGNARFEAISFGEGAKLAKGLVRELAYLN